MLQDLCDTFLCALKGNGHLECWNYLLSHYLEMLVVPWHTSIVSDFAIFFRFFCIFLFFWVLLNGTSRLLQIFLLNCLRVYWELEMSTRKGMRVCLRKVFEHRKCDFIHQAFNVRLFSRCFLLCTPHFISFLSTKGTDTI